jgi:5-methylcytosine-specific restriction protein A
LIDSRIGQGRFRQDLLTLWGEKCAVTGLAVKALLKASHMKPWRASNNAERLDAHNGLLLAPSYDCAFDAGLISFTEGGQLLISPELDKAAVAALGLNAAAVLRVVKEPHLPYLDYHRREVFRSGVN